MPYGSSSIQSIAGGLFFVTINMAFQSMFGIIFLFPAEQVIVMRERSSRTYHVSAYFWSKTLSEFPRTVVMTLLFASIVYWMILFRPIFVNFLIFFLIAILISMCGEGIAYIVSAMASDPQTAGSIAPLFTYVSKSLCPWANKLVPQQCHRQSRTLVSKAYLMQQLSMAPACLQGWV